MCLRPLVCLLIALFSDKKRYVHIIIIGFIIMLIGAFIFSLGIIQVNMNYVFFFSLIVVATGTYLRGLELPELKEDGTLWFIGMDD